MGSRILGILVVVLAVIVMITTSAFIVREQEIALRVQISKIIGVIYTAFALAAFVGPTIAGLLHDRYGDYGPALMACAVLSAVALVASFGITRRY